MRRFAAATAISIMLTSPTPALAGDSKTRHVPVRETLHGVEITDEYRWLEALEEESEDVRRWTTTQNDRTREVLDRIPGRKMLEERYAELLGVGAIGAPRMRRQYYFYTERRGDEDQASLYVREGATGAPRRLLDPLALDEEGLYSLDWFAPSHDGRLVAFGVSHAGDEMTVLHVLETATGEWIADEIAGKTGFGGWAPDGRGFLYSKLDDAEDAYSRTIRWHQIGRHDRHDAVLIRQGKPSEIPGAFLSRNGRWIIAGVHKGWSKEDILFADVDRWQRTGEFRLDPIAVGLDARFSGETVLGNTLYVLSTHEAPNGQLWAVDLTRPERANWQLVVPERPDAVLDATDLARGMLICTFTKDAQTRLERFTLDGKPLGEITLPGLGSASVSTHPDRTEAFIRFESFGEPPSIYHVDLTRGERSLWARPDVPVDPESVVVKQVRYRSKDGTEIPMFIVHRKGLELTGDHPCVLYGYGGFNIALKPRFSATRFPWLDRGGIFVTANLRGGGEYGEAWHRAGMLENKQNVFDDFYAAAEWLIEHRYTRPERLACWGGSNGGLLTGVAVTQRPDLFAAAVSAVPLLDMLRYHRFLMARFWIPEYGSAENAEQFEWLRAYSPYHHVVQGKKYPAVFLTAGENDNRVHPLHARKMAARLQALAGNDPAIDPILLWIEREAGHGAGKPLSMRIRDVADQWSFVMWQTGMQLER